MASIAFKQQGLSLLELCITGSIFSILTCISLPSFQGMLTLRQLEGTANQLWHDLQYGRNTAISLNQNIQFQIQAHTDDTHCYVIHTGSSGGCFCQTSPSRAVCATGNRALKTVILPTNRILLSATRTRLSYSSDRGTISPAATLRVSTPDGRSIAHIVNIHGRIRTCAPDGRIKGIPRC